MNKYSLVLMVSLIVGCEGMNEPEVMSTSNLPRVDLTIDYENFQILNANVFSDRYVDAKFQYGDRTYWVNIRYQGRSTRNLSKKNFRVRFPDGQLFQGGKQTILSSQFRDPSLMRSYLSYDLFRRAGLMTPNVTFVSLFINRKYHGIYLMTEPIDEFFLRNRGKQIGNLYQASNAVAHFTLTDGVDIRLKFRKKLGNEGNYSDIEYLLALLDHTPISELSEQLERIFDVNSYLEYMAVSALIANWDGFINNLHLYNDPQQQRFVVIPWDMDLSFGSSEVDWNVMTGNELNHRLLEIEAYRMIYELKLQAHLNDLFSEQRMFNLIDQLKNLLHEMYGMDPFLQGYSLEQEAEELKEFIRLRRAFLLSELAANPL